MNQRKSIVARINLLLLIGLTLLFSCEGSTEDKPVSKEVKAAEENVAEENHSLALNEGKKWKVDSLMLIHLRNMESEIMEYLGEKDRNTLTAKLESEIDLLTSNCTMEGAAHDALHEWLLPFIASVDSLKKEKDKYPVEHLKNSFQVFNQYFE